MHDKLFYYCMKHHTKKIVDKSDDRRTIKQNLTCSGDVQGERGQSGKLVLNFFPGAFSRCPIKVFVQKVSLSLSCMVTEM